MPKLYFGSRGGIYYRKGGRKHYVSKFGEENTQNFPNGLLFHFVDKIDNSLNEGYVLQTIDIEESNINVYTLTKTKKGYILSQNNESLKNKYDSAYLTREDLLNILNDELGPKKLHRRPWYNLKYYFDM